MDQPKKVVLTPSAEAVEELTRPESEKKPETPPDTERNAVQPAPAKTDKSSLATADESGDSSISSEWVAPDPLDVPAATAAPVRQSEDKASTEEVSRDFRSERLSYDIAAQLAKPPQKARRFLAAYITSILSAFALLSGASYLGYMLLNHFLTEKSDSWVWQYVDLSPVNISVMASMVVFGTLYLACSQYAARQAGKDVIGVRDWRAYKIVYAFFSAVLLTTAASVIASLIYIPFAQMLIADDFATHQIVILVLGGLHVLLWLGVLIWQERLVKHGKYSALQGLFIIALAVPLVLLTAIYPVGSGIDTRYDKRVATDLSRIQRAIDEYKTKHDDRVPQNLSELDLEHDTTEQRLANYKYTAPAQDTSRTQTNLNVDDLREKIRTGVPLSEEESDRYVEYLDNSMPKAAQKYKLCAAFRTDTTQQETSPIDTLLGGSGSKPFTQHAAGEVCFDRT